MTAALGFLALLGVLGTIDTLYFHEYRGRLPMQHGGVDTELRLHAGRDAIYVVVFATLPWLAWRGAFGVVFALLLVAEIVITMADFVVEDRVRVPLGGVYPGERVLHAAMAIVYGAMLASLVPVLARWWQQPTALSSISGSGPAWLRAVLTGMAVGIAASGVRDILSARGSESVLATWPWSAQLPPGVGVEVEVGVEVGVELAAEIR